MSSFAAKDIFRLAKSGVPDVEEHVVQETGSMEAATWTPRVCDTITFQTLSGGLWPPLQSLLPIYKGPPNDKNLLAQIQNLLNTYLKGPIHIVIKIPEILKLPKLLPIRVKIRVRFYIIQII